MSYITLYNLRMVKKKFRFRRIFIFTFPFHSKRTRQKKWQSIRITHYKHVQFYTNEMIKTMSQTWRKLLHATFFQNLRKKWKNHGIVLRIGMPLVGWRGEPHSWPKKLWRFLTSLAGRFLTSLVKKMCFLIDWKRCYKWHYIFGKNIFCVIWSWTEERRIKNKWIK